MDKERVFEKFGWRLRGELGFSAVFAIFFFLAIASLSGLASFRVNEQNQTVNQNNFLREKEVIGAELKRELDQVQTILYALRSYFDGSVEVTRQEFGVFISGLTLEERIPSLFSISFLKHVDGRDLPAFEKEMRREIPDFKIYPVGTSDEHYVVIYDVPANGTKPVYGLDPSANPRRATFDEAAASGEISVSEVYTPVSDPSNNVFLITLPIYKKGVPLSTADERLAGLDGFVVGLFDTKSLFEEIMVRLRLEGMEIRVSEGEPSSSEIIYDSHISEDSMAEKSGDLTSIDNFTAINRTWTIYFHYRPSLVSTFWERISPHIILAGGFVFALLSSLVFVLLISSRSRAESIALRMTEALRLKSQKLEIEKAKDEAVLASIGDGVVVVDEAGKILLLNAAAERLLGWKEEDVLGRFYADTWYVKDGLGNIVTSNRPLQQVLALGETISSSEFYLTRKDGGDFPVYINVAPVKFSGKLFGATMTFHDVSAEKAIDRAKSEFVSLASHQLRTPLSAVSWYAEMLLSGDLGAVDPNQKKYLEEIYESNKRMVDLVNALLNVSRIDLGTFAIEPEDVNVIDLAKNVVTELRPQMVIKKLLVTENYEPNLPTIQADPKLIRIILQNLLTNAVKYTAAGGRASLDIKSVNKGQAVGGKTAASDSILFKVSDNGFGIPEEAKGKVFTKLFRAANVKERETDGTGLGLYIVKSIVDASRGEIWFDSIEKQGSTFYVLLPLFGMSKREGSKQLSDDVIGRISVFK